MEQKNLRFETLGVHAGHRPDATGACAPAIYQSTAYTFESADYAAKLFALEAPGMIYTRLNNPTTDVFEQRMAAMEGGVAAVATASGMSAQFTAITAICSAGDNVVSTSHLYGGTFNVFRHLLVRFGIEVRMADGDNVESIASLIDENTKVIYLETIGNPEFSIPDFEAIAALAKKNNIVSMCDNTFGCAGYLIRPFEYGINVVTHSATKWIGGHATSMGGVIVDGGNFDWSCGRYPLISEPVESYHGVNFYERFGAAAFAVKVRCEGLRDVGACISPFNSFLLAQGLETLALRVQRSCDSALELAKWLSNHPKVESVNYPGLEDNKYNAMAQKYLKNGYGAVLSFRIKGDLATTTRVAESVEMIYHETNVGDNKTIITHPSSTTHSQLSASDMVLAGVYPNLLRLSVGIEHIDDIKSDLDQALNKL